MRKFLFSVTIILSVILIAFLITPAGTWILFAISGSGEVHIIIAVVAGIAFMIGATFLNEKISTKTRRWLLLTICAVTAFVFLSTMNFGGTFHGEWTLVRDASVRGFNISDSPNFRLHFEQDGTLRRIYPDYGIEDERNWQRGGRRGLLMIGGTPYEYRFSRFGNRLTLELSGAERPKIPHMTPQSALEIVFRRSSGMIYWSFAIIVAIVVAFAIYKKVSTPEEKLSVKVSEKAKWQTRNGGHHD